MPVFIICIIYVFPAAILLSFIIKNFLKMRTHDADSQLYRQYFFTAIIILCLLFISLIAILVKIQTSSVLNGSSGIGIAVGQGSGAYFDLLTYLAYILLIMLVSSLLFLFDRYLLKRTAKNKTEYHKRRRLVFGILSAVLAVIALIRLVLG